MAENSETTDYLLRRESDGVSNKPDDRAVSDPLEVVDIKLQRKRWYILLLFSLYSATNAFQWIQYSIISNIITRFYTIPIVTVDWLSLVYMVAYIPLIFPVTWLLDRKGLRIIAVVGSSLNAAGALVKVGSARSDLFVVTMVGQTVCAIAQVFILGMPAKIAATWFGPNEVSTACSLGVFGNQLGVAVGFLLPPRIVPDVDDTVVIEENLRYMFIGIATLTSILAVLVLVSFQEKPDTPPSLAQSVFLQSNISNQESYINSIKDLILSVPSVLLIVSYGINTGSFYAIGTLLNQEILEHYPNNGVDAGQIGLTMILSGIAGSVLCGVWLDRSRIYKKTTVVIYVMTLISMAVYTGTLSLGQLWIVYVTIAALGFTMTGYLPIGFEFAAELTFPISEGTSSGLLNASAQIFGIIFTIVMGTLIPSYSVLISNIFICAMLFLGSILTVAIREELKRERANRDTEFSEGKVGDGSYEALSSSREALTSFSTEK